MKFHDSESQDTVGGSLGAVRPGPTVRAIREAAIETLRDCGEGRVGSRLAVVESAVAIELTDAPDATFVIHMGGGSVTVEDGDDPRVPIRLIMDSNDLHELFVGGLHLPMKIARGQVAFTGPVRRFLRIAAILLQQRPNYERHLGASTTTGLGAHA